MTNTERMKAALRQKRVAATMAAAEAQEVAAKKIEEDAAAEGKPAKGKKRGAKVPAPPRLMVRHRCGHELPAGAFNGMDCQGCRGKAARKRNAERRKARDEYLSRCGRLPAGAAFAVEYDATREEWAGTLTIPGVGRPRVLTGTAPGVHQLLSELGSGYWEQLARAGEEAVA